MKSEVSQTCPTLCDPMDCSLPGSSDHVVFQARILEGVAIPFSIYWNKYNCIRYGPGKGTHKKEMILLSEARQNHRNAM